MNRLFAYGTLMLPEVLRAVTARTFPGREAVLVGFARLGVRGETYPALVERRDAVTRGMLYEGLDSATLERLDVFEGELYERRRVRVRDDDQRQQDAFTYVVPERFHAILGAEPWDPEVFRTRHLQTFLDGYPGFARTRR